MLKIRTLLIAVVIIVCSGCTMKPVMDREAISVQIRSVMDHQVAGWNSGSVDDFMNGYWPSDSLRFASGGNVTYGWQATLDRYKRRYDSPEKMGKLAFDEIDIRVLTPDYALVFGRWSLRLASGEQPWGRFTLLFQKKTGKWVVVHDHTSSGDTPPAEGDNHGTQ